MSVEPHASSRDHPRCDTGEEPIRGCDGGNATGPAPAIAPGSESIDPVTVARAHRTDPRLARHAPGFDAPFFQAGLAGYSDAAMRLIARRHGAPFCVTEALLDRTLLAGGRGFAKADLGELEDNIPAGAEDHPLAGQIMGSDPDTMAAAALKMIEQGRRGPRYYRDLADKPDAHYLSSLPKRHRPAPPGSARIVGPAHHDARSGADYAGTTGAHGPGAALECGQTDADPATRTFEVIDVNLACPVKKVSKMARGGHWLREPEGAIAILKAVREAMPGNIAAGVKLRRGWDDSPEAERNFYRIFDAAYDLGYAWTTVHGRTVEQKYVGPSRWTFLRDLCRRNPDRLIFGSGDVWDVRDIFRMIAYTGVQAVSVARGCIGNPWIFRQAREMMAGRAPAPPAIHEQRAVLLEHFDLCVRLEGEARASRHMRKFGVRFAAHHPRPDDVRRAFIAVASTDDWRGVIAEHYGESAALSAVSA